jgi:pentatricopeptide repeat protein
MKKRGLTPDAHAVGALIAAFAQAMSAELHVVHERKERFLLLERALGVIQQAQQSGLKLSVECYNALIVCAGRCGQLNRALGMLETLQLQGLRTDAYTYGALMEACMASQRPDLALRLFNQAHQEVRAVSP